MTSLLRGAALGAAAGAAGTTALNLMTYLDMAVRGRPASSTPEQSVERMAQETGLDVPGEGEQRSNRIAGLGPMMGIATGVVTGAAVGVARAAGLRGVGALSALGFGLAMVASNAPMAALGVSDPREWDATSWAADVVPHAAYGLVTAAIVDTVETG